ncbi:MAG: S24 family peptidase [Clostridium sp.]
MDKYLNNKTIIQTKKTKPTSINSDNFIRIPILNSISDSMSTQKYTDDYHHFPKEFFSTNKDCFSIKIKDNSMNNLFISGDFIIIEKKDYFEDGDIVAILVENVGTTVRKIVQNNSLVTLIPCSSNEEYISYTYNILKVKIIGKIIGSMRRY